MQSMPQTTTPKALAAELNTNPKALRRFMRGLADAAVKAGTDPEVARVGQGNRYDLTAAQAKKIKAAWNKAHGIAEAKPAKAKAKATPKPKPEPENTDAENTAGDEA